MVYLEGIEQPVGYRKPVTSIDVTVGDGTGEVYVSKLKWFCDVNNNGKLDNGEDSASYFNNDGSFVSGRKYSVYVELEARDRDGDGESDYIVIPDDVGIFIANGMYIYQLTGNKDGAVYTFEEAIAPEKAVQADTTKVVFDLAEGYDSTQKTITFTSVGTTTITSINAKTEYTDFLNVTYNGMKVFVSPAKGLTKGNYITYAQVLDENGNVLYKIQVIINVAEKSASIPGDINNDAVLTKSDIYEWNRIYANQSVTPPTEYQLAVGDLNKNGKIDIPDKMILNRLIG